MKALFLSIAVLLFSSFSYAEDYRIDSCLDIREKARIIMEARQIGAPIQEVFDPESKEYYKFMVADAYQTRIISNDYYRQLEVIHFSERWYNLCMKYNNV